MKTVIICKHWAGGRNDWACSRLSWWWWWRGWSKSGFLSLKVCTFVLRSVVVVVVILKGGVVVVVVVVVMVSTVGEGCFSKVVMEVEVVCERLISKVYCMPFRELVN